jgi:anti-sigma28 factor (negative regulator of flagellin synthesis)
LNGPHFNRTQGTPAGNSAASPADQLNISAAAEAAVQAVENGEIRADLVARVRNEIAAGAYETPEKLGTALDRLLDEIS